MLQIPDSANKGLENIIACSSEISTIHDSTLLYRGYTIEDLAKNSTFEEVVYLLWHGSLPNCDDLKNFKAALVKNIFLPEELTPVLKIIADQNSHSMSKLRTAVSFLGLLDPSAEDNSVESLKSKAVKTTGTMAAIISGLSRLEQRQNFINVQLNQSFAWNFLNMARGKAPNPEEERLFDTALILHADHELNASTFAARVAASTTSDYYSCITSAIGALKGPLHGGANEHVMIMLNKIGSFENVDAFLEDAITNKKKVMGIGHRVYKQGDPRARILKEMSLQICTKTGLLDFHKILTRIEEQMGTQKGLTPNVDFYSGLVYTALGLRPRDFTPLFVLSRITGWSAQIFEQHINNRIYRPRAFYTGAVDLKTNR